MPTQPNHTQVMVPRPARKGDTGHNVASKTRGTVLATGAFMVTVATEHGVRHWLRDQFLVDPCCMLVGKEN